MHSGKRVKTTVIKPQSKTLNPFTLAEMRHELYEYLPAQLIGKLGLLAKVWKQTVSNEYLDNKKLVLKLIDLNYINNQVEYRTFIKELLSKNPFILKIKDKQNLSIWENILSNLIFKTPINDEDLIKTLFLLEPKYALKITYLNFNIEKLNLDSLWGKVVNLLVDNYNVRSTPSNIKKIESIKEGLLQLTDIDDNLLNFITISIEPILLALKKDWPNLKNNIAQAKFPIYRNFIGNNFNGINLENLNLNFADFNGARLIKAMIKRSTFNQSIFIKAKLNEAQAEECQFINADMSDIEAFQTNLSKAILNYALLDNADLKKANLLCASFEWAILTNATLNQANGKNAIFSHAKLDNSSLKETDLTDAVLNDASLTFAILDKAKCDKTDFSRTNLDNASICTTDLTTAILNETTCFQAIFFGSIMPNEMRKYVVSQGGFVTLSDFIDTFSEDQAIEEILANDLILYVNKYIELIKDCFDDPNSRPTLDWLLLKNEKDGMEEDDDNMEEEKSHHHSIIIAMNTAIVRTEEWLAENRPPRHSLRLNPTTNLETACQLLDEVLTAYKTMHSSMLNQESEQPEPYNSVFIPYFTSL